MTTTTASHTHTARLTIAVMEYGCDECSARRDLAARLAGARSDLEQAAIFACQTAGGAAVPAIDASIESIRAARAALESAQ